MTASKAELVEEFLEVINARSNFTKGRPAGGESGYDRLLGLGAIIESYPEELIHRFLDSATNDHVNADVYINFATKYVPAELLAGLMDTVPATPPAAIEPVTALYSNISAARRSGPSLRYALTALTDNVIAYRDALTGGTEVAEYTPLPGLTEKENAFIGLFFEYPEKTRLLVTGVETRVTINPYVLRGIVGIPSAVAEGAL